MSEAKQTRGAGPWLILSGIWLIYFGFGVIMAAMGPLITPISAELGIGRTAMGAILGAWPFVYIVASVPCGLLLDRLGARHGRHAAAAFAGGGSFRLRWPDDLDRGSEGDRGPLHGQEPGHGDGRLHDRPVIWARYRRWR